MSWRKRIRRETHLVLVRWLLAVVGRLPRRLVVDAFAALGALAHGLFRRERRLIDTHMAHALPELDGAQREQLVREVFVDLARNAADIARMLHRDPRELLEFVDPPVGGEAELERARAGGRGVVVTTGHFGAWELLAGYYAQRGLPLSVVARPLKDPRYQRLIERLRDRLGVRVFHEGDGMRALVREIRGGGVLGILIDQTRDARGMWIPFLGRPAWTPVGPVELARLARAPLLPVTIHRVGRRHRILMGEAIEPDWSREGAAEEALRRCSAVLEDWVRSYPTQWVWMYDRWEGPPDAPAPPAVAEHEAAGPVSGVG
jgi:KDO2-lipid IV(A) lauroyltransferase